MNLYVIGPVTGMPGLNRAAFAEARSKLVAAGYSARIPHDFIPSDASHELAMRMSIRNILDNADGVAVLDGWLESDGAKTEYVCAVACGVPCLRVGGWVEFAEKGGQLMGTNFYLRRVKPRMVHDEYHIAKRSAGWKINFQNSDWYHPENPGTLTEPGRYAPYQLRWPEEGEEPPRYKSAADIRALLESGEYQLADEYGTTWGPGVDSVAEFDELCRWMGGQGCEGRECSIYPDGEPPWEGAIDRGDYRDADGYMFSDVEFS